MFDLDRQKPGSATIILRYENGSFSEPEIVNEAWYGDQRIERVPAMTVAHAMDLLKAHGITGPYWNVTLRMPLSPGNEHPLHIFRIANSAQFWGMDSATGEVRPIH